MENTEKSIDVVNDLIRINNDRAAGFEKAAKDLDGTDTGLETIFSRLAGESQQNAIELTNIAEQYTDQVAVGTSASGDIHRAWIDIKSAFTGSDPESILNECERGEDAIKAAYKDALDPENELNPELIQVLQRQEQGIIASHNQIRSLRDQAKTENDTKDESEDDGYAKAPVYTENEAAEPSYTGTVGEYEQRNIYNAEPETSGQEEAYAEEEESLPAIQS